MTNKESDNGGESWDFERAEKRSSARRARAVVSVAFSRQDFDVVATAAAALDMKLSEFIRSAALEAAGRLSVIRLGTDPASSQARWSYVSTQEESEPRTVSEGRHPLERTTA